MGKPLGITFRGILKKVPEKMIARISGTIIDDFLEEFSKKIQTESIGELWKDP